MAFASEEPRAARWCTRTEHRSITGYAFRPDRRESRMKKSTSGTAAALLVLEPLAHVVVKRPAKK
jgi:hypothetical protein